MPIATPATPCAKLKCPVPRVVSAQTYHLVCRTEGLTDPRIAAFRDWLVESLDIRNDG